MATICLQCGDKGFANALVYCVKCLDFAVHRYCLDELPKTSDEFVYWFCEECEPKAAKIFPLGKLSSNPSRKSDQMSLDGAQVTHSGTKLKKKEAIHSVAESKEQRLQMSPFEQPCETPTKLDLTSRARLLGYCSPVKIKLKNKMERRHQTIPCQQSPVSHTDHDLIRSVDDCSSLKPKLKDDSCSMAVAEERRHQSSSFQQPCEAHSKSYFTERAQLKRDSSSLKMKLEWKKAVAETKEQKYQCSSLQKPYEAHTQVKVPDCALWRGGCSPLIKNRGVPQGSNNCKNHLKFGKQRSFRLEGNKSGKEPKCSRIDASRTGPADLSDILEHNYLHAQPIIDPIWRGSFSIYNKKYDGVVAHLSSKACSKVYEEASLLPSLLYLEMLPKTRVWPKSFERSEPSDDNIAMYIFPGSRSCERVFDCLVEDMMSQELGMRAMVKNAELLVFASTELPLPYWRFRGKFYLWGVFRGKQRSSSDPANRHLMVQSSSSESIVYSNSVNDVGTGEVGNLTKTKTRDARSPLSPLSNSDSFGSGSL